jgi:2-polyprenyl-3-methyl-5-hydroxy-6-metoxy-1,4-benzoquinol methylase
MAHKTTITDKVRFSFLSQVLKMKSFHFGYWDETAGEDINLTSLLKAQDRYTELLLSQIQEGTKSILDVGCGIGEISDILGDKGYSVTAISPELPPEVTFKNSTSRFRFIQSKFEDFQSDQAYDLILMSESHNYFDHEIGFNQCKKLLAPDGHLIVSGLFKRDDVPFDKAKILDALVKSHELEFIKMAEDKGLKLLRNEDITENVLPTLVFAHRRLKEHVFPIAEMFLNIFPSRLTAFKLKLIKRFFSREIKHLVRVKSYLEERLDPHVFQRHIKYLQLLFVNDRTPTPTT